MMTLLENYNLRCSDLLYAVVLLQILQKNVLVNIYK